MDPSGTRNTMRRSTAIDISGNLEIVFCIAVVEGAQRARYLGIPVFPEVLGAETNATKLTACRHSDWETGGKGHGTAKPHTP